MKSGQTQGKVIALGFFDGVHRGHAALLRETTQRAQALGYVASVVTFDRHPENLIVGQPVPLINTPADRADLMRRLFGIQEVIFAHFDEHMMHMPWDEFITGFLRDKLGASHLVAGHDFHFGYKGQGNPARLREKCAQLGLGCDIIPKVEYDGITVSSTYIRKLIAQGEMERANDFLGHPHVFSDTVHHGRKIGSSIGIPTINMTVPDGILVPARGVYATRVCVDGMPYNAMTNVGIRPTVDSSGKVSVETNILDFSGELYGKEVRVEYYAYLRPEIRFESLEALKAQIYHDREATREYFGKNGF
ncbi:bifunctional riboflavin kinase/FAD synthetase [Papillibacter cinnamivorans]|uniref:Riboflavin biosynthesis protein n=1 Tax=Papillibacter cinnamivorans DSM 12816 TaxID=1122930 RepID=A0A1W2BJW6_9FIRM|nr:bifunctional riboflavin kinase/FAD synthetase [Papillibacter cinnamivorans]SMC73235.1 riboflavin kinase / FMN adenylyltransferase [Papillibacter cinnamivorans DSM 12816]